MPGSSDERVTPDWLYEALHAEFGFALDAAASAANHKCFHYCGLEPPTAELQETPALAGAPGVNVPIDIPNRFCHGDGLEQSWIHLCAKVGRRPAVWLNPPYSRGSLPTWLAKAESEARAGCTVVALIPGDTSTDYFHRFALRHERRYLNRRLSFAGAPNDKNGRLAPAKFGSVLVVFRPTHKYWTWG